MLSIPEMEEAGVKFVAKLTKNKFDEVYAKIEVTSHLSLTEEPLVVAVMDLNKTYRGVVAIGGHLVSGKAYAKITHPMFGTRRNALPVRKVSDLPAKLSLTHVPYTDNVVNDVEGFANWDSQLKAIIDGYNKHLEEINAARSARRGRARVSEES